METKSKNGNSTFKFKPHVIDTDLVMGNYGQTALADINNDGKPEFIMGLQRGDVYYYKYNTPDNWDKYLLGEDSPSDVGVAVLDVDGDGWLDLVTGGAWYKNSRKDGVPFEKIVFDTDLHDVHDVLIADMDGDGKPEVVTMSDALDIRWYKIPEDPAQLWKYTVIGPPVHAGLAVGDLTGNGSTDVVRTNAWFENVTGDGSAWHEHPLPFPPQNKERLTKTFMVNATYAVVCDMNKDGKNDIVMIENEMPGGKLFWLENVNGDGSEWMRHDIYVPDLPGEPMRGACHTLIVADMDGDGDFDIMTCEMEDFPGDEPPKYYIIENVDGKGGEWKEHVIADCNLGGHDAVMGDVTGNGLPDFVSKPWLPVKTNAVDGKPFVLFLENIGN
ncbi:MAG: VCBS repeat-containing protein [Oscillospiraceae bacterium]|nr:VCBS repeat-containing protein [Oscillospiraceae bacterium]